METALIEHHLNRIDADGYTIVEGAIDAELNDSLRDTLRQIFVDDRIEPKGNRAEGFATRRLYNLVPRAEVFQQLPVHEQVLPIVESLLEPDCLLSGTTAMDIGPGEQLQGLHADDGFFKIGRPHRPMMSTTIWALTDFTADNGATRIVPGSHRDPGPPPSPDDDVDAIAAEMPAGSVMIMDSQLWHCGGPNTTDDDGGLASTCNTCGASSGPSRTSICRSPTTSYRPTHHGCASSLASSSIAASWVTSTVRARRPPSAPTPALPRRMPRAPMTTCSEQRSLGQTVWSNSLE